MEDLTLEEYLRGKVCYEIPDNALRSILANRNIAPNSLLDELSIRDRELSTADLYMWCVGTPSVTGTIKDADGGWSHQEGGVHTSSADKKHFRKMANAIYRKYGEEVQSSIRMVARGMKIWH